MTLHDVSSQLYNITLDGFINGEQFTKHQFESALVKWMQTAEHNKIKNTHVLEISLPDGRWFCEVIKYADRPDGYDYFIPENREQEQKLLDRLTA